MQKELRRRSANMLVNQESMKKLLLNVYEEGAERLRERNEIIANYCFYNGPAEHAELEDNPVYQGQSWKTPDDLDFRPSKDIRNHTKKLIQKQGRFMFGEIPSLSFKPFKKEQKDQAEAKRTFIDTILEDMDFWGETYKAFMDCTIGKRVLMTIIANEGEPAAVRYYRADCFSYKTDPLNYKKLTEVIIAFQEESTIGQLTEDQRWLKYKYYLEGETVKLASSVWDGNGEPVEDEVILDTGLKELPCKVILNGGLLGDGLGTSDVAELRDLATAYNKTYSDYRDALRFKMFEQPVFMNASEESIDAVKIQPNSLVDLKGDPTFPDKEPKVTMLSSTFSFQEAAKIFLDGTKADMYEIMDQPRPEDLRNVPSAKTIKFIFYDLMARCKEKWKTWMPAIRWAIQYILNVTEELNLYQDQQGVEYIGTEGRLVINPRYPIPEDEETVKGLAMKEVEAKVRSHKSYIRDISDIEDEDGEYTEVLEETKALTEAESSPMPDPITDFDPEADEEGDTGKDEEGEDKDKKDKGNEDKGKEKKEGGR